MSINELRQLAETRILNQELNATITEHRKLSVSTLDNLDRVEIACERLMGRNGILSDQNAFYRTLIEQHRMGDGRPVPNLIVN